MIQNDLILRKEAKQLSEKESKQETKFDFNEERMGKQTVIQSSKVDCALKFNTLRNKAVKPTESIGYEIGRVVGDSKSSLLGSG